VKDSTRTFCENCFERQSLRGTPYEEVSGGKCHRCGITWKGTVRRVDAYRLVPTNKTGEWRLVWTRWDGCEGPYLGENRETLSDIPRESDLSDWWVSEMVAARLGSELDDDGYWWGTKGDAERALERVSEGLDILVPVLEALRND